MKIGGGGGWKEEIAHLRGKRQLTTTDAARDMKQLANADCADKAPACLVAPKTDRNLRESRLPLSLRGTEAGCALHSETTPLQQPPGGMPLV